MKNEIKKKYRAKELALYLGTGVSTIWRWTKQNKIRSQKISNGVTVFDIDDVLSDLGLVLNEEVNTLEEDSIELSKSIELCSEICSKAMNRFKDLRRKSGKKKVIVFISSNPKTIDSTLRKSLKDYDIALDYRLITDIPLDFNNYDKTNYQMFIVTRNINSLRTLDHQSQEFIVIDLADKKDSKKSSSYLDLMVKNIKKYKKFNISTTKGGSYA